MIIQKILLELPARVHGLIWKLIFSTEANGFSLNQLYRRSMEVDQDTPALLLVKDIEQNVIKLLLVFLFLNFNCLDIRCLYLPTVDD